MKHEEEIPTEHASANKEAFSEIEGNLDVPESEIEAEHKKPSHPRALVMVENQDNGERIRFWAPLVITIGEVIVWVYDKFRLTRHPGDRLFRIDGGVSVFGQEALTVEQYLDSQKGHSTIHWALVSDQGGAAK